VTEIEKSLAGHALIIDSGWGEVADKALAFVQCFTYCSRLDNGDYKAIDLATGNTFTLPASELADAAALQELLPLGGDRGYVGWVVTQDGAASVVVLGDGDVRQIYAEDPDPAGGIQNICLSPNGQYLAVAKLPRDAATNPDSAGFANKTELIDTATGRTDHEVAGSEVNWCNQNATS
jgi:hypothetical protein